MHASPEVSAWDRSDAVLRRVRRRLITADVLMAASFGGAFGALLAALARHFAWPAIGWVASFVSVVAVGVSWLVRQRARRSAGATAARIERLHPHFQNVVFTAVELSENLDRAQSWVRQRVFADAEASLRSLDPRTVVSLVRPVALCIATMTVAIAVAFGVHERAGRVVQTVLERAGRGTPAGSNAIAVIVEPPSYTRLPITRLSNPERIDAVEGTRLRIDIDPSSVASVRFGSVVLRTVMNKNVASAELTLKASGYLAVESQQRLTLIPVRVMPDRPPAIRVEQPGHDLLLVEAKRFVSVEASVTDDYAVANLTLRYTKVSGSGEQFEFREGELPLTMLQRDRLAWRGRATFALPTLGLQAGDSLVYRFVARDDRAGEAGMSASDTFFIEIAGPDQVAVEGMAMPPDRERYALSQQMIVLKIERLRQRESGLAREAVQEQGADIAAEQRAVKANFIFLMGGHVEDEEIEAEQSSEIQEGRLENTSRREIVRAIDDMTRTEQALAAVDTASALRHAKLAVEALQRAFGQNRYILRALQGRDRIDPTRRLTGKLDEARGAHRSGGASEPDVKAAGIRGLFTSAMGVADDLAAGRAIETKLPALSESALAIDPSDPTWQRVAQQFGALRDRLAMGESRDRLEARLRDTLGLIAAEAQRVALTLPIASGAPALRSAWAHEFAAGEGSKR
jgi:uncharacterized protein DUF4175